MTRKFKAVKSTAIILILFSGILLSFTSSSSAQLFGVRMNVKMEYTVTESNRVVPLSGELIVPINVSTQIEGVLASFWEKLLSGITASVDLRIKETPAWATGLIEPNVVNPDISQTWDGEEARVHISFDENAPANLPVKLVIEMTASAPINRVKSVTKEAEISFTPTFLPIIDVLPKSTFKEVGPGEVAFFELELENLGNAETEFLFSITDIPEGWIASIPSNIKVGSQFSGGNPKKTIQLTVTPPYNFGYHNELVTIKISAKGRYFAGSDVGILETEIPEIIFTMRNRGFSTPGFEIAILFGAIIIIFVLKKQLLNR